MSDRIDVLVKLIEMNRVYYDSFITIGVRTVTLYLLVCAFCLGIVVKGELFSLGRYMIFAFLIVVTVAGIAIAHYLLAYLEKIRMNLRTLAKCTIEGLENDVSELVDFSLFPRKMAIAVIVAWYFTLLLWIFLVVADVFGWVEFPKPGRQPAFWILN